MSTVFLVFTILIFNPKETNKQRIIILRCSSWGKKEVEKRSERVLFEAEENKNGTYLETSSHRGPFWLASLNLESRRDLISRRVRVSCLGHLPVEASPPMHPAVSPSKQLSGGVEALVVVVGVAAAMFVLLLLAAESVEAKSWRQRGIMSATWRPNIIISKCCVAARLGWPPGKSSALGCGGMEGKWVDLGPFMSCLRSVMAYCCCCCCCWSWCWWWWLWWWWWSSISIGEG